MRTRYPKSICVVTLSLLGAYGCLAQEKAPDAQPAATPPAAPAPAPEWSVGPITFSGLVDGYYNYNPAHPISGFNDLRNFDVKANQFSLNMAKITLQHDPDPMGFRLDLGFGRAFDIVHGGEQAPNIFRYVEQAFVSFKPPKAKGFQVDFGKFVTSAGAEVIETKDNWNYSRSILFAWAIPYYHFGVRTSMPFGSHFTAGVQLVNGWNSVEDINSGKTVGLTAAATSKKVSWNVNYYAGPERATPLKGTRQLIDTTLMLNPTGSTSFYLNYDYGKEHRNEIKDSVHWDGVAGAARFQVTPIFALSPRIEWFSDPSGASIPVGTNLPANIKPTVKEFTMTGEFKAKEGILMRLEYRRDWANANLFYHGNDPFSSKNQTTLVAGFVAFFGPKR
jgi:hypothetical protein